MERSVRYRQYATGSTLQAVRYRQYVTAGTVGQELPVTTTMVSISLNPIINDTENDS